MAIGENSSDLDPNLSTGDLYTRIGLLVVLLVSSALCSLLPVLCARLRRRKKGRPAEEPTEDKPWKHVVLSFFNCFAGGVFLGVTFLHLLPDITEDWEKIFREIWPSSYPFDKFLIVIGFFIVLVVEQVAYAFQRTRSKKQTKKVAPLPPPPPSAVLTQPNIVASLTTEVTPLLQSAKGGPASCKQCRQDHVHHAQGKAASASNGEPAQSHSLQRSASARYSSPDLVHLENGHEKEGEDSERQGHNEEERGDNGARQGVEKEDETTSPGGLRAVFLGLALSVHSVFEGLSFGLIPGETDAIQIFLGIAIHKAVIGVSLGIALVTTHTGLLLALALVTIFVLSSPIGAAIGLSLRFQLTDSVETLIAGAVLQALACGTFAYITFLELIGHEFAVVRPSIQQHRLLLVLGCLLGFALMAGLTFLED